MIKFSSDSIYQQDEMNECELRPYMHEGSKVNELTMCVNRGLPG